MQVESLLSSTTEFKVEGNPSSRLVNIYDMSSDVDRARFFSSLGRFALKEGHDTEAPLFWRTQLSPDLMIERALERNFLRNDLAMQEIDHRKLTGAVSNDEVNEIIRSKRSIYNDVVIEFPWLKQDRFVAVLPKEKFQQVIFSRNKGIFSEEAYNRLKNTKIAIIGAGVGTMIAETLIWLGAENLIVIDGGEVGPHDTQRLPSAGVHSYGNNHANHLVQMAYEINPYGNFISVPKNIGASDSAETISVETILKNVGLGIEEIDDLFWKTEIRRLSPVPIVMGTDVGLRGGVERFEPGTPIFQGRLDERSISLLREAHFNNQELPPELKNNIVGKMIGGLMSADFLQASKIVREGGGKYWPQPGIAARITSAMLATLIMLEFENKPVKDEVMIDLKELIVGR